jgi:hypothetical protein
MEHNPLVTNLTKTNFETKIKFGESPLCPSRQTQIDCWVTGTFDDRSWQSVILPRVDIQKLRGDKKESSDWIYYRLKIPIADALLRSDTEISFTPTYILHKYFEIYLEGMLIYTSNGGLSRKITSSIVNVPLPRAAIQNNMATIVIKGRLAPDDFGIFHHGWLFLGPKYVLDEIQVHAERAAGTYYLLYLLSKGSIFIVFCLFFFFTNGQRGLFNFLVFGFFGTANDVFVGDFLNEYMSFPNQVLGNHLFKVLAAIGLMNFFADFYQSHRIRMWLSVFSLISVSLIVGLVYDYNWGTKSTTLATLTKACNNILVIVLAFGLCVGTLYFRTWYKQDPKAVRTKSIRNSLVFLSIYMLSLIWEFYFSEFKGFEKRALFDLFFFYYVSFIVAKDFAFKEEQVVTLEGHMAEKFRMEEELKEASEISKALLPESKPDWLNISVDVFHKPLTESSGDWFAFEKSPDGNLHHIILCDITGHGVQAAIVASACRTTLSCITQMTPDIVSSVDFIKDYAKVLNSVLFNQGQGHHLTTIAAITFDLEHRTVKYMTAGHPPLFLIRAGEKQNEIKALQTRNSLLGLKEEFDPSIEQTSIVHTDQILLYTDGLPIQSNIKGLRNFLKSHKHLDHRSVTEDLYAHISLKYRAPNHKADDVSIIWLHSKAA